MLPTLQPGDRIIASSNSLYWVRYHAKYLNNSSYKSCTHMNVRDDVFVFQRPSTIIKKHNRDLNLYYVKRCIGVPKDSISIVGGYYIINGKRMQKNIASQSNLSCLMLNDISQEKISAYPHDHSFGWNIKDFGPLYIPAKGDSILLTPKNLILYKSLIEFETSSDLSSSDSIVIINNQIIDKYHFKYDYYFMAGDNVINSEDSRYWGPIPSVDIIGKVYFKWKPISLFSKNPSRRSQIKHI